MVQFLEKKLLFFVLRLTRLKMPLKNFITSSSASLLVKRKSKLRQEGSILALSIGFLIFSGFLLRYRMAIIDVTFRQPLRCGDKNA